MKYKAIFVAALALGIAGCNSASGGEKTAQAQAEFTDEFPIGDCQFNTEGENPYFTLEVGRQLTLDNAQCVAEGECEELEEVVITVLDETRDIELEIDGEMRTVSARVVEEFEQVGGELEEISRNFFAECEGTQDVYYFGEEVDIYEDGVIVDHEGAWLAGVDGAMPGIIMPGGAFLLGARYYSEIAPDVALDRGEHVGMGLEIEVPAGTFEDCVEVEETNPLEPEEVDTKIYCPGTGIVIDEDLELVEIAS